MAVDFAYALMQQLQARIEMEGMIAENQHRISNGHSPMYGEDQFNALIEKHGVYHNAFLTQMQSDR
ncbi:MAG: hypothetical protein ACUZ8A_06730 [Candidatus Bathyanammoxibius sp.]